jgi:hypothetical protein
MKMFLNEKTITFGQLGDARVLVVVFDRQKVCSNRATNPHCSCPSALKKPIAAPLSGSIISIILATFAFENRKVVPQADSHRP